MFYSTSPKQEYVGTKEFWRRPYLITTINIQSIFVVITRHEEIERLQSITEGTIEGQKERKNRD